MTDHIPRTRSAAPYLLIVGTGASTAIVGYAHSTGPAVRARARRLRARIVANPYKETRP